MHLQTCRNALAAFGFTLSGSCLISACLPAWLHMAYDCCLHAVFCSLNYVNPSHMIMHCQSWTIQQARAQNEAHKTSPEPNCVQTFEVTSPPVLPCSEFSTHFNVWF